MFGEAGHTPLACYLKAIVARPWIPAPPERCVRGKACERAGNAVAKAEQIEWADSAGRTGPRARACGREFLLLDRLQALDWQRLRKAKGREMAIKEVFGPAEADAMTR
jgi:hypothetical protein